MKTLCFFVFFIAMLSASELPLQVGMELSYPPFEMIDHEGQPAGISVAIANALAKDLNRNLIIDNIPFVGLIPALKTGKIDLIISSLTITKAREESIDFSEPYLTTGLSLLVSKKRSQIASIKDTNRKDVTLVVKSGTSGETYARENLPLANVVVLDKESSCVLEVVQGKADAFIYDQFSVYTNWQKNLETTYALLEPFQKEYWGIGIQKGNQKMVDQVNAFINQFRKMGGFEQLGDQYLADQKAAFKQLGIPFVF